MHKLILTSACLLVLGVAPSFADTKLVIKPTVDTWVMKQKDAGVTFQGDIVVGQPLPDTVMFVDVPDDPDVAFVYVNKKRVLVDRKNRTVIKVYE